MYTTHNLHIYKSGLFTQAAKVKANKSTDGDKVLFIVQYSREWFPAFTDSWGCLAIDLATLSSVTKPAKPAPITPQLAQVQPQVNEVTYEAWKAGKMDRGPKVTAPRGKGAEWAARLYCERAIERAKWYRDGFYSRKNYRTGSYNYNRRKTIKGAHQEAWHKGIEIAEAVVNAAKGQDDGYWEGRKELVQEAFGYTDYLLYLAGN
jgi:hypothetical protein